MSAAFYKHIIEDEMKSFGIKKQSLKNAANSVGIAYSKKARKKGNTFVDYNLPSNRCAYLYKYASIHTRLVEKYFRKLLRKKQVKSVLNKTKSFKICCLGGGPGTDIVGLFKVLSLIPHYHNRIIEVTVLDICGGWRNSFKRIMSSLVAGEIENVPATFVNTENCKFQLIEVNLLNSLPVNVAEVISKADIVCMVKFVSAILGSSTSVSALKVIGEKLKVGAVVMFIDNFEGNVFKSLTDIADHVGLKIVTGPLHEGFSNKKEFIRVPTTVAEKEVFGCLPLSGTKVTVLGYIKSSEPFINDISDSISVCPSNDLDDDDGWNTDNESDEISAEQILSSKNVPKASCDKFTQTFEKYLDISAGMSVHTQAALDQTEEISRLAESLCDLASILIQWQEKLKTRPTVIVIDMKIVKTYTI